MRQAGLTGATVEAAIAWHYPVMVGGILFAPIGVLDTADYGDFATRVLSDAIKEAVDPGVPVKISSTAQAGHAAQVLLDVSGGDRPIYLRLRVQQVTGRAIRATGERSQRAR
ncbi:MAG: hypothetical protein ACRDOK_13275 [Streptosporangiaceae bacterium]